MAAWRSGARACGRWPRPRAARRAGRASPPRRARPQPRRGRGRRQERLLRELEKLAIEYGPGAKLGAEEVHQSCVGSAERKVWTRADALVAGDRKGATRALVELREQGERLPGLLFGMVRRVRDAVAIAEALEAGQPASQVKKGLRMP